MTASHEPSHPPSDPHGFGRSGGDLLSGSRGLRKSSKSDDRSLRARIGVAVLAGLVLIAAGLYLWRRPHAPADAAAAGDEAASSSAMAAEPVAPAPQPDAGVSPVALSDARVLGCHDRGPKVTPPDQCDHLAPIEKALASAVEQSAACVSPTAGGGTIEYVADVSFRHHRLSVTLPHEGRSVHDRKALRACAAAVRAAMQLTALDGVEHQHAQYRISLTATYRAAGATGAAGAAGAAGTANSPGG
jgi:hypothetical protein